MKLVSTSYGRGSSKYEITSAETRLENSVPWIKSFDASTAGGKTRNYTTNTITFIQCWKYMK